MRLKRAGNIVLYGSHLPIPKKKKNHVGSELTRWIILT